MATVVDRHSHHDDLYCIGGDELENGADEFPVGRRPVAQDRLRSDLRGAD
jgi:hypothetical protein